MYFIQDSEKIYRDYKKKIQGEIFAISVEYGLDSYEFIKKFLESKIARSMDKSDGSRYWLMSPQYTINCFLDDCDIKKGKSFRNDEMEWLGEEYRELSFISSSAETATISPDEILKKYKLYD